MARLIESNHLLNAPRKRPQSQIRGLEVFFVQLVEDAVHLVIIDDADDGIVQSRPCMGAVMWLARVAAVAFDFVPFGEALRAVVVQHLGDFVVVGLVIGY